MLSTLLGDQKSKVCKIRSISALREPWVLTEFFGVTKSRDCHGERYSPPETTDIMTRYNVKTIFVIKLRNEQLPR